MLSMKSFIHQRPDMNTVISAHKTGNLIPLHVVRVDVFVPLVRHLLKSGQLLKPVNRDASRYEHKHTTPNQAEQITTTLNCINQ